MPSTEPTTPNAVTTTAGEDHTEAVAPSSQDVADDTAPHSTDDNDDNEVGEETTETEDDAPDYGFESDAAAAAAREEGLKAYNEGRYESALDQQYRVVRYFSDKYGATAPQCAKYFLDYGLSQLRVLQSQSSLEDALAPRDQEALETCYINLEVARVGLQKLEAEKGDDDVDTELAIAEVHNALAQLNVEKEDFAAALLEYEAELILYRGLQQQYETGQTPDAVPVVPPRRIFAVLYGIADCYMKEADFDGAAERLQATLDEIARYPADTIEPELVHELRELLADANEMKGGKYKELQEAIQQQFAPDVDSMPTAQEFYEVGEDARHPFHSSLPETGEASHLSMPMSASGQVLGLNEHSNSQSLSLFPPQGSRGHAGGRGQEVVQQIVARKKPKAVVSIDPQPSLERRGGNEAAVAVTERAEGSVNKRVRLE